MTENTNGSAETPTEAIGTEATAAQPIVVGTVFPYPLSGCSAEVLEGWLQSIALEKAKREKVAEAERVQRNKEAELADFALALRRFQSCFRSTLLWTMDRLSCDEWACHPVKQECYESSAHLYAKHKDAILSAADFLFLLRNVTFKDSRYAIYVSFRENGNSAYENKATNDHLAQILWPKDATAESCTAVKPAPQDHALQVAFLEKHAAPALLDARFCADAKTALLRVSRLETLTQLFADVIAQRFQTPPTPLE